jgi:hypothetical protein
MLRASEHTLVDLSQYDGSEAALRYFRADDFDAGKVRYQHNRFRSPACVSQTGGRREESVLPETITSRKIVKTHQ